MLIKQYTKNWFTSKASSGRNAPSTLTFSINSQETAQLCVKLSFWLQIKDIIKLASALKKSIDLRVVAVGTVNMCCLVWESKGVHSGCGESSTTPPGVADGKAHAAVLQPPPITTIILLETPHSVKLTHQGQLGSLASAGVLSLLEGERSRKEGDRAWGDRVRTRDKSSQYSLLTCVNLTRRLRGEAKGIKMVVLVFGSITAKARERFQATGRARNYYRVLNSSVTEPAGIAPVQTLRPCCRRHAGQLGHFSHHRHGRFKHIELHEVLKKKHSKLGQETGCCLGLFWDGGRRVTSVELLLRCQPPILLLTSLFGFSIGEPVAAIFTLIWKHHTLK